MEPPNNTIEGTACKRPLIVSVGTQMDLLKQLLEAVPAAYRLPLLGALVFVYFGFPFLRDWRANKSYWEFRKREFEITKLYFETKALHQSMKIDYAPGGDVLVELRDQLERLRPKSFRAHLPYLKRIAFCWLGALFALSLVQLLHVIRGEVPWHNGLIYAFSMSIPGGVLTSIYPSRKNRGAFWFGFGGGVVLHIALTALYMIGHSNAS